MRVPAPLRCLLIASFSVEGFGFAELQTATHALSNIESTITAAPKFDSSFEKRNDARFIGWISTGNTWFSGTCGTVATYDPRSDYWACCSTVTDHCNVPFGCISGTLLYRMTSPSLYTASWPCSEAFPTAGTICYTDLVYEGSEVAAFARTHIGCGKEAKVWTYYRMRPSDITSSAPSTTSQALDSRSTSTTSAGSPTTATATPTSESKSTSATSVTSPTDTPINSPASSKSWIAGAVVGSVVGVALIGAFLIYFLRRKNKDKAPISSPSAQNNPDGSNPASTAYDARQKLAYSADISSAPSPFQSHGSYAPPNVSQMQSAQQQWTQFPQQIQEMLPSRPSEFEATRSPTELDGRESQGIGKPAQND